jgi:hypothetical protein
MSSRPREKGFRCIPLSGSGWPQTSDFYHRGPRNATVEVSEFPTKQHIRINDAAMVNLSNYSVVTIGANDGSVHLTFVITQLKVFHRSP